MVGDLHRTGSATSIRRCGRRVAPWQRGIFGRGVRIENARNVDAHGNQANAQQLSLRNRPVPSVVLMSNAEVSFHTGSARGGELERITALAAHPRVAAERGEMRDERSEENR